MSITTDPGMLFVNVSLAVVGFLTIFLFQSMWKDLRDLNKRMGKLETDMAVLKTKIQGGN